jgi:hypothetical protein
MRCLALAIHKAASAMGRKIMKSTGQWYIGHPRWVAARG